VLRGVRVRVLGIVAVAAAMVTMAVACTPPDTPPDSTTSTTSSTPSIAAPNLTSAFYEPFGPGVALVWTGPTLGPDQVITDYLYDMSCDGGTTTSSSGHLNLTFRTPNVYEACDTGATPSSFRLAAVVNSTLTTPYSSWVTLRELIAPTLTGAATVSHGVSLTFVLPPPLPDGEDAINGMRYDLSCDGGATVFSSGGISTWDGVSTTETVTTKCASGPSTYRVYASVVNWLTPRSGWVTAS
jgi:hypothetical protein